MSLLSLLGYYLVGAGLAFITLTIAGFWNYDRKTMLAMTLTWFFWCIPMAVVLIIVGLIELLQWLFDRRSA